MALAKQAKVLSKAQVDALLDHAQRSRNAARNTLIILLSVKAGMRAIEIAALQWSMVVNADGRIGDEIALTNAARRISSVGGALRDVQALAGHASLTTQRYIEVSAEAKKRVMELV